MRVDQMPMVRVFFSKTGRAKYTSHLDLMRLMTRALRRTKLPCWYTQGFNPHLYMTFALPIALGTEGLCESVDLRLTEHVPFDEIVERMNHALPPDIRAIRADTPKLEPASIAWADYTVRLGYADPDAMRDKLNAFFAQPAIEVVKRTKKAEKTVDIKPLTKVRDAQVQDGELVLRLRSAAGISLNISPSLLLGAFEQWTGVVPFRVCITREAILTETLDAFA